jgi:hypothetical protein
MKLRNALSYMLMLSLLALLTACGSGGGSGSASGVKASINFANKAAFNYTVNDINMVDIWAIGLTTMSQESASVSQADLQDGKKSATLNYLNPGEKYLIRVIATDDNHKVIYSGQKVFDYAGSSDSVTIDCYSMDGFENVEELYSRGMASNSGLAGDEQIYISIHASEGWAISSGINYTLNGYFAANKDNINMFDVFFITTDSSGTNVESTATGTMNAITGAANGTGVDLNTPNEPFSWWLKPFVQQTP